MQDPDAAIHKVPIVRTLIGDRAGAVPSEAYQYDLVFECFTKDEEFQRYWRVPKGGWARCSTEESISQKNSYIRVVMDLDKECKLYPTAYTPGFPTVPRDISDSDLQKASAASGSQQKIPGLPEGYSVALDVYILKDAEILLKHQRAFRGRVDAAYRWLDVIVNGPCQEELESGELAMVEVTPMDNSIYSKEYTPRQPPQALLNNISAGPSKHWTWHSSHLDAGAPGPVGDGRLALTQGYSRGSSNNPMALQSLHEAFQPAAKEELPLSCLSACPRGLKEDPTLDEAGKRMQDFRKEIHMENALINAFGDHVGLPLRDSGATWGKADDGGAAQREKRNYDDETRRLERQLDDLWSKTVNDNAILDYPSETMI